MLPQNNFFENEHPLKKELKTKVGKMIQKEILIKNIPYYEWSLNVPYADATQIFKTY